MNTIKSFIITLTLITISQIVCCAQESLCEKIIIENNNANSVTYPFSNSKAKYDLYFFDITPDSTPADDVIAFGLLNEKGFLYWDIVIYNISENIVYIDLSNCFMVKKNTMFSSFYDGKITTETQSVSNGVSLGLGAVASTLGIGGVVGNIAQGITLGSSSGKSVSTTTISPRIIAIPPHAKYGLTEKEGYSGYYGFYLGPSNDHSDYRKRGIKDGDTESFTESNSLHWVDYYITYSTDREFGNYKTLHTKYYLKKRIAVKKSDSFDKLFYSVGNVVFSPVF